MKILFTGFAPFDGGTSNPSFDCLRALPGSVDGAELVTLELPVSFAAGPRVLLEALEREQPQAVVCLGLAAGRKAITPEKVGINFANARIPDNDGAQPVHGTLVEGGPDAYFSTLPLRQLLEVWEQAGIPAELSCTAGAYVCNSVLYHLMAWATPRHIPAGFVHVPSRETLPLSEMTRAMVLAAELLVRGQG